MPSNNAWSLPKIMVGHEPIFDSGQKETSGFNIRQHGFSADEETNRLDINYNEALTHEIIDDLECQAHDERPAGHHAARLAGGPGGWRLRSEVKESEGRSGVRKWFRCFLFLFICKVGCGNVFFFFVFQGQFFLFFQEDTYGCAEFFFCGGRVGAGPDLLVLFNLYATRSRRNAKEVDSGVRGPEFCDTPNEFLVAHF